MGSKKHAAIRISTIAAVLWAFLFPTTAKADAIDSLQYLLTHNEQIQEKVYLHTDNNCYYVGDTIWYKAYVLNADNLKPEALSKVLYVELLTPDGYLVERQRVIIDHHTQSHGQFYLSDSIYSGFYELRAYTRWQLNFNTRQRAHSENDDRWFYNRQLANDYFTENEGLFSRVLPIYEKPLETGDYTDKRIIDRPRRRQAKDQQDITMTFYPEGGAIIAGIPNRIAFETLDNYGMPIEVEGTLSDGTPFKSIADGRGIIDFKPSTTSRTQATIQVQDKTYTFVLPEISPTGATISYDVPSSKAQVVCQGTKIAAVTVTCRGRLVQFAKTGDMTIDASDLPTGVNEIVVYDAEARPLAVRQIFVNHHDCSQELDYTLQTDNESTRRKNITAAPYQRVSLKSPLKEKGLMTVSVSVRDLRGDLPSYGDGNIMTDLLLAGDLRGFVAHPSYYFESDDLQHRERLDLLMMVQGWRKYAPIPRLRYKHERNFQMEGRIYKLNSNDTNEFDLLQYTHSMNSSNSPTFTYDNFGKISSAAEHTERLTTDMVNTSSSDNLAEGQGTESAETELPEFTDELIQNERRDHKYKAFKERVLVEAELVKGKDVAGVVVAVDSDGYFAFDLPPFYDQAIMFMTAYAAKDSIKKCLSSKTDKDMNNPFACPDFYVRRETFYPKFTQPYSWFQTHTPEEDNEFEMAINNIKDSLGLEHHLDNVVVKTKRRRVLHAFDRNKPAMTKDFAIIYNEAIDYGLHYSGFNSLTFYEAATRVLFGNMNNPHRAIGIKATVDNHTFLRTYMYSENELTGRPMTDAVLNKKIDPRHIWKLRIFTDFDMRNGIGKEENRSQPDIWYELVETPGTRVIRRDRRFVLDGFAYPDEFYHCDYSNAIPSEPTDYRRTYYWNANAHPDKDGNLNINFYNGSRPSLLQVSIYGISPDGKIYY